MVVPARAPHPALDRRVEHGGRGLLSASSVAPGARRGPGHAAGAGHAKTERARKKARSVFFFLSSEQVRTHFKKKLGSSDVFALPIRSSLSLFPPSSSPLHFYHDLQHPSGALQCLPRHRLCEHVVLSASSGGKKSSSAAQAASRRRRRRRRRWCIEVRFAALLPPFRCPFSMRRGVVDVNTTRNRGQKD